MAEFGALTMVGVIATILSIGFAFAAFINSRRREAKKNESAKKENPWGLPFLSTKEQIPENVNPAKQLFHSALPPGRQVIGQEQTNPAFKQVQVLGPQSRQKGPFNSDEYLWE